MTSEYRNPENTDCEIILYANGNILIKYDDDMIPNERVLKINKTKQQYRGRGYTINLPLRWRKGIHQINKVIDMGDYYSAVLSMYNTFTHHIVLHKLPSDETLIVN